MPGIQDKTEAVNCFVSSSFRVFVWCQPGDAKVHKFHATLGSGAGVCQRGGDQLDAGELRAMEQGASLLQHPICVGGPHPGVQPELSGAGLIRLQVQPRISPKTDKVSWRKKEKRNHP